VETIRRWEGAWLSTGIKGLTLLRDLGHNRGLAATRPSPIYLVEGRCNAN